MVVLSEYQPFSPPFELNYKDWKPKQARTYFEWFEAEIPERLQQLRVAARECEIPDDVLSLLPDSLSAIGDWMDQQVATRPKTEGEIVAEKSINPRDIYLFLNPWEFTAQTESLIVDWGIYFAETLRNQYTQLTWDWVQRPKSSADFHQPILVGFASGDILNAVAVIGVLCQKVTREESARIHIQQIYDVWSSYVTDSVT